MREPLTERPAVVQGALGLGHAVIGHLLVDLPRQLDELGRDIELARAPAEVEGVHGQAVSAHAGARVEAHEPVGLGRGRVDDLPDVDAHAIGEHRKLVDERDVDRAEDVLEQLGQLGGLGAGYAHELIAHQPVERFRPLGARLGQPTQRPWACRAA